MNSGNCFQSSTHESMVLADLNSGEKFTDMKSGKIAVQKPLRVNRAFSTFTERAFHSLFDTMTRE